MKDSEKLTELSILLQESKEYLQQLSVLNDEEIIDGETVLEIKDKFAAVISELNIKFGTVLSSMLENNKKEFEEFKKKLKNKI